MEKCKQKKSAYQKLLERNKGVRGIRRIKMDLEDIHGKIMNRKKISRIMKELNLRTLKSLAKVFNCTLDDLINLTDAKTPVLLDEQTVKLIEKLKNNDSIKRLFELVSVMDNTDVQAVI